MTFTHPERHQLVRQLETYCAQNRLEEAPDWDAFIEDCTCREITPQFCVGDDDGRPRKRVVTLKDIRDATVRFTSGSGYADQGTATERAVVCAKCPLSDRSACPTCTGLVSWGTRSVGNREVKGYSDILGVCELDAVLMSAGVFAKSVETRPDAPENCWRKA